MPTFSASGLSAEAKEFVPLHPNPPANTIPLYIDGNTIASVYTIAPQEQTPLMYPPIHEIEFRIPPTVNDNPPPLVLYPTAGCYPGTAMTGFYPMEYPEPPMISYPLSPAKSNQSSKFRPQRGSNNHPMNRNPHPTNSKPAAKIIQTRFPAQKKENIPDIKRTDQNSFQIRPEDFPGLSTSQPQSEKILTPLPIPIDTNSTTTTWSTVVSRSRPVSTSPSRSQRSDQSTSSTKKATPLAKQQQPQQQRAQSSTDPKTPTKAQEKRAKKQKKKNKEPSTPSLPTQTPTPESISFSLDDENAFPTLGQEISKPPPKQSDPPKDNVSTPGLISKSKIKANHTYQIRLTDMFNALSTSTQTKSSNPQSKVNKSSTTTTLPSANPLDSNPAPKRGKEREQPKPRKPTKLKRIINKELEENQKQRQQLLTKSSSPKQLDQDIPLTDQSTSASCTEDSDDDDDNDDDDDDATLDPEPTSQMQTPYAQPFPQSNIQQQIHNAGFREYCAQLIDRPLDELCIKLLITLKRFQDRKRQQFQSNPERARRKRRFVHGIREVTKHLRLKRLKCVLIAPDCQSIQSEGGLNDALTQIIDLCKEQTIPYVFTLNRQKLGRCLRKTTRVSAVGIFDYSGADDIHKQIVDITNENQRAYQQIVDHIIKNEESVTTPSHGLNNREFFRILHRTFQQQQQQQQQRIHIVNHIPNESLSKVLPKVAAHHGHSRQTSDTSMIYIDPQLISSIKKQHTRASSGTFDMGTKSTGKKTHQRTLSDGAAAIDNTSVQIKHPVRTHSRTPSGCSAISQIEQQDYFEQSKSILLINNSNNDELESEENRLKSINEDTEENSANIKRKHVEKWINDN